MVIQQFSYLHFYYSTILIKLITIEFRVFDEFQEASFSACIFHTIGFRIRTLLMRKRHSV